MKQVIYVDVLIAVNLFVNYFLLLTVAGFFHLGVSRIRLVGGAAIGAVCSLVILLPPMPAPLSLLVRLLISAAVVLASFGFDSPGFFLKIAGGFYLTSFGFAGFMLAVWYLAAPKGMVLKNSVLYFDISPFMLLAFTIICYGAISLLNRITGQRQPSSIFCKVTVYQKGQCARITAKIDTGNSLKEPFSGYPVIVAEYQCVEPVIPEGIRSYLFAVAGEKRAEPPTGLRLVPFQVVGGQGVLPSFRPEKMVIETKKESITVTEAYLAVSVKKLGTTGFSALLNPELLTQGRKTVRKEKSL